MDFGDSEGDLNGVPPGVSGGGGGPGGLAVIEGAQDSAHNHQTPREKISFSTPSSSAGRTQQKSTTDSQYRFKFPELEEPAGHSGEWEGGTLPSCSELLALQVR